MAFHKEATSKPLDLQDIYRWEPSEQRESHMMTPDCRLQKAGEQ